MRSSAGPVEPDANGPPAERRIFLLEPLHIGQHLVAADVERAESDRAVAGRVEHGAVKRLLRGQAGKARGEHELQFGAEQSDRLRAGLVEMRQVDQQARRSCAARSHAVER